MRRSSITGISILLSCFWMLSRYSLLIGRKWEDKFFKNEHENNHRDDGIAENCLDESWSLLPGFVGKEVKAKTQKDGETDECLLAATKCRRRVQDACANSDHRRGDTQQYSAGHLLGHHGHQRAEGTDESKE